MRCCWGCDVPPHVVVGGCVRKWNWNEAGKREERPFVLVKFYCFVSAPCDSATELNPQPTSKPGGRAGKPFFFNVLEAGPYGSEI